MPARRFWSFVDFTVIVVLILISVGGCFNYRSDVLAWTFVIIMTFEPIWILLRMLGAIRSASSAEMREQHALTHMPARWFVDRIVSHAMWRSLWPVWLMLAQCVAICIFEKNWDSIVSVMIFTLISLSAICLSLCSVWDQLRYNIAPEEKRGPIFRSVLAWRVICSIFAATIPILLFGRMGASFPAYVLVFAPLVLSAGPLLVINRYRRAVVEYFQFE